jgi:hypothetical protein
MLTLFRSGCRLAPRYARPAIWLALVLALGLIAVPATRYAEAAPVAQLGPLETTSGTVVSVSGGNFQLERPALSNPNTLEQLTVQPPAGVTVADCDIVSLSGHYNIPVKIFMADSLSKLGSACQMPTVSDKAPKSTDIDSSLDNENEGDDDNDNGHGHGNH